MASIESKAARASEKGAAMMPSTADAPGCKDSFAGVVSFSSTGSGGGECDTKLLRPVALTIGGPPKKFFNVVWRPENSSKNLVANRGGSGASRGGIVGYAVAVGTGRSGGLSRSRRCRTPLPGISTLSCRSR